MSSNLPDPIDNTSPDPQDASLERDMLELKLRAEFGMLDSHSSGEVHPEIQQMFLQQVYDFEKNFAKGTPKSFAESLAMPDFEPWPEGGLTWAAGEEKVNEVLEWYREHSVDIGFGHDYPPAVKYNFLTKELPQQPNYYGKVPGMLVGVIYEEYVPNHGEDIEENAKNFLDAFFNRNANGIKSVLWREQVSPEAGPYDGLLLVEYLENWFASLSGFEKYDYSILQTSYDWFDGEPSEKGNEDAPPDGSFGMGYAEGMVGYIAHSLIQSEPIKMVGPFKLYFEFRDGQWGIIYPQFPGLPVPPVG